MRTRGYVIVLGLLALVLSLGLAGCLAKDYKETIGPYEVSFSLPDAVAALAEVNKSTEQNKTYGKSLPAIYSASQNWLHQGLT